MDDLACKIEKDTICIPFVSFPSCKTARLTRCESFRTWLRPQDSECDEVRISFQLWTHTVGRPIPPWRFWVLPLLDICQDIGRLPTAVEDHSRINYDLIELLLEYIEAAVYFFNTCRSCTLKKALYPAAFNSQTVGCWVHENYRTHAVVMLADDCFKWF